MKLAHLRLYNFWSFGGEVTDLAFEAVTFLLGPNGAGKTAVLQALARMFSHDPAQRAIRPADFYVPVDEDPKASPTVRELWLEADFEFPELAKANGATMQHPTVAANFAHMRLEDKAGPAKVRFRLKATMDDQEDIEESLTYVISVDADGNPLEEAVVPRHERKAIQVAYLPAQRDPADHISYSANAMLGRALKAAKWGAERDKVTELTTQISASLVSNQAMKDIAEALTTQWGNVHKSEYYSDPSVAFPANEIESLLRYTTVTFAPGHEAHHVDFRRLSDGQQSLLYLSLVLAMQSIGRKVLTGELGQAFDVDKLRPPVFTLIGVEEPENSLSPHSLGRVTRALTQFAAGHDAQAVIATHSPSLLRRVAPENIRYLRLNPRRQTTVKRILLPSTAVAHKFVREGVQAYPELYFSRFVVLGEGDSEEVVLARLLEARGLIPDDVSISVVPLGGRHVNHFWRLLNTLGIPHATLLDLDLARFGGGWGRIKYAAKELLAYLGPQPDKLTEGMIEAIPDWDDDTKLLRQDDGGWIARLESFGVFFAAPLDLDFMMLTAMPLAYGVENTQLQDSDETTIAAVLGKTHASVAQYSADEQRYFDAYHTRFKLGSKPTWHLSAMGSLDDKALSKDMPEVLKRLFAHVTSSLSTHPE